MIVQEIKAKIAQIITLPVRNWLMEIQRFSVTWEIEGVHDPGVIIRGANTIDVPPGSMKDYKLNFVSYKQGVTKFTVKFTNLVSKEYLYYNLEMKVAS
jgi:hypothetical protein|mmetsp:Transcript_36385/g.6510  ORF Transcript_36385/g.6510 Transcript_36385/m.6510 type:complete len:98 (+) Transcript_36385:12416-12709(+)